MIVTVENQPKIARIPAVREKLNVLKEVTEDYTEHLAYSTDTDVGILSGGIGANNQYGLVVDILAVRNNYSINLYTANTNTPLN